MNGFEARECADCGRSMDWYGDPEDEAVCHSCILDEGAQTIADLRAKLAIAEELARAVECYPQPMTVAIWLHRYRAACPKKEEGE